MVPLEKTCSQKCSDKNLEKRFQETTQVNKCINSSKQYPRKMQRTLNKERARFRQRFPGVRQNQYLLHMLFQGLVGFTEQARKAQELETNESMMMGTPREP